MSRLTRRERSSRQISTAAGEARASLIIAHTWDGTPLPPSAQASVTLSRTGSHLILDVDAPYNGDPAPASAVGPTDGLWSYEVVELFVVGEGHRYTEIELSPHGHHWVLRLEGIRNAVDKGLAIEHAPRIAGDRWHTTARVPLQILPTPPLTCNAYRIAGVGENRRFDAWAPVPGDGPNFHRLEHFRPWPLP